MSNGILAPEKGTWVLLSFIAFFAVIIAVNAVYIITAVNSHSGVITDKPYEKGLAYDETLESAKSQPELNQKANFKNGVLRWELKAADGVPIDAKVTAHLVRPVKKGYDFDITFDHKGNGIYEAKPDLPLKGKWEAQLKAQWDKTSQYKTRLTIIAE